jgi:ABC-type antimicrobial peptide transport system permease subunit
MGPVLAGVAAGLTASIWATAVVRAQLFEVAEHDPETIAAVVLTLVAACAATALIPAERATRVNPIEALKAD